MRSIEQFTKLEAEAKDQDEGGWMLSYVDVFVILTAFFIFASLVQHFQSVSPHAAQTTTSYQGSAFNEGEGQTIPTVETQSSSWWDGIVSSISNFKLTPTIDPAQYEAPSAIAPQTTPAREAVFFNALNGLVERENLYDQIQVERTDGATRMDIQVRYLFSAEIDIPGAKLSRSGKALLQRLSPVISETQGSITIEGHTDDLPILTQQFSSNWSLAAARATEVLSYFSTQGIDVQRLSATSFADTRPLVPNTSETLREKNRRVTIVVQE